MVLSVSGSHQGFTRRPLYFLAILAVVGAVAGCRSHSAALHTSSIPKTSWTDRHPVTLAGDTVRHDVLVGPHLRKLTKKEKDRLEVYLNGYLDNGAGALLVRVPEGTVNEAASLQALGEIQEVIWRAAVDQAVINYTGYTPVANPDAPYPIVFTYQVYETVLPECGYITDNLAGSAANKPSDNFGCSSQRNLGAMVANPSDLRSPRHRTPADRQRRSTVFEKYRRGEDTSTQVADEEAGTVSEVAE